MSIVVLQLPDVKGICESRPSQCPYCQGEILLRLFSQIRPPKLLQTRVYTVFDFYCFFRDNEFTTPGWLSDWVILLGIFKKGEHAMERPISSFLRSTFLVHLIIGGLLGIFIFLIPGRTLTWLGWVDVSVPIPDTDIIVPGTFFVDGIITRVLGAALLALAFSSFLGWRASTWGQVALIVQVELVYCLLGSLVFIAGFFLLQRPMPIIGYVLLVILLAFVAAWGWAYRQGTRT